MRSVRFYAVLVFMAILVMNGCGGYNYKWEPSYDRMEHSDSIIAPSAPRPPDAPIAPCPPEVVTMSPDKEGERTGLSRTPLLGSLSENTSNEPIPRLMAYSSFLRLVVPRVNEAIRLVQEIATRNNGYMQEMVSNYIIVRVPSDKFDATVSEIEKIGEVIVKEIKGSDVTEEMQDLELRIKNAEDVRNRLSKLLEKCDKIEDALKVEKELERLTLEIEMLKGKLQSLRHKVSFSIIRVEFNIKDVVKLKQIPLPFSWVARLGLENALNYRETKGDMEWFKMDIPEGFVKVKYSGHLHGLRMVSADGVTVAVSTQENPEGGTIEFWKNMIRRALVEGRAYAPIGEEKFQTNRKIDGIVLQFENDQAFGKPYRYDIVIFVTKKVVYIIEIAGPAEMIKNSYEKIKNALITSRI